MRKILFLVILTPYIIMMPLKNYSQGFEGVGLIGLNLSQLDGDTLYGFDRIGLSAGASLQYDFRKKFNIALEALYSQRGSSTSLFKSDATKGISLSFIELPIVASIYDWYIDKANFYKVRLDAGLSYGYLFRFKAPQYNDDYFNRHDVSYILGAAYRFNKKLGISLRYTAPFGLVYQNPTKLENKLTSYFLTLRGEIYFN
jgi:hypothetical protein